MSRWRDDPADVKPMLASLADPPITGAGLVYEPKYDGIRALASIIPATAGASVALYSRNGLEKQDQFPEVTRALQTLGRRVKRPLLLDGEIVAIDPRGVPLSFQYIQGRIHLRGSHEIAEAAKKQPTVFVAFDLIRDGDRDLRGQPLAARRIALQQALTGVARRNGTLRLSELAIDDGRELLARARDHGWEGLIVKDGSAPYHSGRRTPSWRKLKLLAEQEFVVGGWTEPRESRQHFGALLLGYYDDRQALVWAGHVGTGFTQADLVRIAALLKKRTRRTSPFAGPVRAMEKPHWVEPDLVAQVRFIEWTSEGLLRQPVFLGLRDDKPAAEVRRETARQQEPPAIPAPAFYRGRKRSAAARAADAETADPVVAQLQALEDARRDGDLALPGGESLHVTNLAKVFWPDLNITKGELMRYYAAVAPLILPAVADRPLVMRRFPHGVAGQAFYQQKHPVDPPPGVRREVLPPDVDEPDDDGPRARLIGGSLTTLLYTIQLGAISQDPWFSRVDDPLHQDHAAIDLDPGDDATFEQVFDVARWVKEELDAYGIPACPKTSGVSGLHIYIRLPPETTYETGQLLCRMIATAVAAKHPRVATIERMVKRRPRRTVYVDFLQNILGKTLATAYSARASDYAGVSTPLTWDEVARGVDPRDFTIRTAPARFKHAGDIWGRFLRSRPVDLHALTRRTRR
jgi:bifunctional non-homologous end joining protein LigD